MARRSMTLLFTMTITVPLLLSACHKQTAGQRQNLKHYSAECQRIKRKLMFDDINRNTTAGWQTPSERTQLGQLYGEYNCEEDDNE